MILAPSSAWLLVFIAAAQRTLASRGCQGGAPEHDWVSLLGTKRTDYVRARRADEEVTADEDIRFRQKPSDIVNGAVKDIVNGKPGDIVKDLKREGKTIGQQCLHALPKALIGAFVACFGAGFWTARTHEEEPVASAVHEAKQMPEKARKAAANAKKAYDNYGKEETGKGSATAMLQENSSDEGDGGGEGGEGGEGEGGQAAAKIPKTPKNTISAMLTSFISSFSSIFASSVDFTGGFFPPAEEAAEPNALLSVQSTQPGTGELQILWIFVSVMLVLFVFVLVAFGIGWMIAMAGRKGMKSARSSKDQARQLHHRIDSPV